MNMCYVSSACKPMNAENTEEHEEETRKEKEKKRKRTNRRK